MGQWLKRHGMKVFLCAYILSSAGILIWDSRQDDESLIMTFLQSLLDLIVRDLPDNALSIGLPVAAGVLFAEWLSSRSRGKSLQQAVDYLEQSNQQLAQTVANQQLLIDQLQILNRQFRQIPSRHGRKKRRRQQGRYRQ